MKYVAGVLVAVLVIGGVLFGFNIGKNHRTAQKDVVGTSNNSAAIVLDLSNKGLTEVTADIYKKTATTELLLSNNSIRTLPSQMGAMTNIVIFKVDHNILDGSLIGEIRQMAKLEQLDVSYNNMTGMPAEIGQLSKLQTLNYSYNKIDGLPNELGNLKNNLKELNLTGNPLPQDTINKLKAQLPSTNIIF